VPRVLNTGGAQCGVIPADAVGALAAATVAGAPQRSRKISMSSREIQAGTVSTPKRSHDCVHFFNRFPPLLLQHAI